MITYVFMVVFYLGGHPIAGTTTSYPTLELCNAVGQRTQAKGAAGVGITNSWACVQQDPS
jgi:hypothetical protein